MRKRKSGASNGNPRTLSKAPYKSAGAKVQESRIGNRGAKKRPLLKG